MIITSVHNHFLSSVLVLVCLLILRRGGSAAFVPLTDKSCCRSNCRTTTMTTAKTTTTNTPLSSSTMHSERIINYCLPWNINYSLFKGTTTMRRGQRRKNFELTMVSMVKGGEVETISTTKKKPTTRKMKDDDSVSKSKSKSKLKKSLKSNKSTSSKSKKSTSLITKSKSNTTKKKKEKTTTTKSKKTTKKKKKKSKDPIHWMIDSDEFLLSTSTSSSSSSPTNNINHSSIPNETTTFVRFKIRGNPLPLRRHRTNLGFIYNPSAPAQASFRELVQQLVYPTTTITTTATIRNHNSTVDDDDDYQPQQSNQQSLESPPLSSKTLQPPPLFSTDQRLVMSIIFRLKRPKSHFRSNTPGPDRLKGNAPSTTSITRTDIDNLAKFVLDALNEVLYEDDRQIMSLHVTKLLDNDGMCQGSTEVCLQAIPEDQVDDLLNQSMPFVGGGGGGGDNTVGGSPFTV